MDHLLHIGDLENRKVPRFSTKPYEGDDFAAYLEREGWTQSDISVPTNSIHSTEESNAFIQTWLFFGVLREFFGDMWQESDFIDEDGQYINTRLLRHYVAELHRQRAALDNTASQTYESRIVMCLHKVDYEMREIAFQEPQTVDSRLLLSIAILCDFLQRVCGISGSSFAAGYGLLHEVSYFMVKAGWCPSTIKKLCSKLDPASFYLASKFKAPNAHSERGHLKCVGRQCLASQMVEATYRTAHVCPTSDCEEIKADHQKLFIKLQAEQIPLVVYAEDAAEGSKLELIGYTPGLKYVAISHVWSDKMGNPRDNALPRCQMERIQHLVNTLYEPREWPVPFWIDTLSCPTEPEEATNLAITYMRKTYSEADKVLMLDSFIQSRRSEMVSDVEIALAVICSNWTRRLWTLQEGALAKSLVVQFSDGAIELDVIHANLRSDERWREYTLICNSLDEIRGAWQRKSDIVSSGLFVDYASAALRYRATSVATDEALCLTTLSGLNMEKILEVNPEDRMKEFWSLLTPPAKVVFRAGETLKDKGFRWAPSSFLSSQEMRTVEEADTSFSGLFLNEEPFPTFLEDFEPSSFNYNQISTPLGHLSRSGLTIQWRGMTLGTWMGCLSRGFFVRDENGRWFFVGCHMGQSVMNLEPSNSEKKELALLLEKPFEDLLSNTGDFVDSTTALILSVSQHSENTIYAHIESVGFIQPHIALDNPSENDIDIRPIVGLVETCESILRQNTQEQNMATGLSSSIQAASNSQNLYSGRESSNPVASTALHDEEGLRIDVHMNHGKITILRDGEHIFFDGGTTPSTQSWCID